LEVLRNHYEDSPGNPRININSLLSRLEIDKKDLMMHLIRLREMGWVDYQMTEEAKVGLVWLTGIGVGITDTL
ncbi:MAG: hypothetical protein AAFW84_24550, partial [Cyanobacteria bacterium J06635_15]